jgi:hypothetical protein
MKNAAEEIVDELRKGEKIEAVVFGEWGWGRGPNELGYNEPHPPPVPLNVRGKILTWRQAKPLMQTWRFSGGYGAPECYAVNIWTTHRVFWVTQYDGSTSLCSAERNPVEGLPGMPGG